MFSSRHHNKSQHVTPGEPVPETGGATPHGHDNQEEAGRAKMADRPATQQVRQEVDVSLVLKFLMNSMSENI